jgi:hypothetical protein
MAEDPVARVYRAALAQDTTEGAAFLERVCGGDATLHAAVDGLLASRHTELQTLAPEVQPDVPRPAGWPAYRAYRLLGLIGHGGMGGRLPRGARGRLRGPQRM